MKIYKHIGSGHYIGSCIIVVAESIDYAEEMILHLLDETGLWNEPIDIKEYEITRGNIIHLENGDY